MRMRSLAMVALLSACGGSTPANGVNDPPSFVDYLIDPPFGPLSLGAGQSTVLKLAAVDPNPDPVGLLYARLFLIGTTGLTSRDYTQDETTLTYPAGTDVNNSPLTQLTGSFFPTGADLCALFPGAGDLFVVVADRDFSNDPGMENTAPGGSTSENHWDLHCN